MTERGRVRFGDTSIDYEVRRSSRRRKTVQITMVGGGVQVAAPTTTPVGELCAIVRKRAGWILSHASDRMLEATSKRFVSGETLPYLGRNVQMVIKDADVRRSEICFDHWRFWITAPKGLSGDERYESIRRAVVRWYRSRAEEEAGGDGRSVEASARTWREVSCACARPASALGKLRARRDTCASTGAP